MDTQQYLGKTVQYVTDTPKAGRRQVTGVVVEISEVPGQEPWFKFVEDVSTRIKVPVWYALDWIEDWKVLG